MIETLLSIENILTLVEKYCPYTETLSRPWAGAGHQWQEYMGIHRTLEQQDFANGFLQIRYVAMIELQSFTTHRLKISRSMGVERQHGKRFRQFQMHVQDEDFLEQLHSINREEFHPLFLW